MSTGSIIEEGRSTEAILKDGTFRTIISRTHDAIFEQWLKAETVEEREVLHARYTGMSTLLQTMQSIINDGEIAAADLAREQDTLKP